MAYLRVRHIAILQLTHKYTALRLVFAIDNCGFLLSIATDNNTVFDTLSAGCAANQERRKTKAGEGFFYMKRVYSNLF
jgi:hypothetical protein